jgi:hypothetical protein
MASDEEIDSHVNDLYAIKERLGKGVRLLGSLAPFPTLNLLVLGLWYRLAGRRSTNRPGYRMFP